jgi:hypothetical protein
MHRRSKRILTVLGIIVVILAVTYAILLARSTIRLRRAYAALAADGRPMRTAEIIPPKVPDADNGAVLYQSAVLMLKGQPAGDKSLYERLTDHRARPKTEAEIKELIGQEVVANALSLVEQGTRRPACQLEHDNGRVLELTDAPPIDDMRNLASVLTARAKFEAGAGRPAQAWDLVLTQLRLADSLRSDPTSSAQFTRMVMARWACQTAQRLCETTPPDREHGQAFANLVKRQDDIEALVRAIDGERLLIGEWFFHLPKEELDKILRKERSNDKITPPALLRAGYRLWFSLVAFKPRLVADHAAYLEVMRKRVQQIQGPYQSAKESRELMRISPWNFLACKLTWAIGSDKWFYCRSAANLRLTRAGLALLQYQQAHGTFPETLEALGLEKFIDPYTEEPLHYRTEGKGFVVYSVGEDLKDNNGSPMRRREDSDPRRKPIEYDEVWRFPNPENRAG